jgi:hypothetical protein
MLPAAALMLTACSGPPSASPSPSPSPTQLIAYTATDVATCHQFAAEQAGQISADQFDIWLRQNGGQTTIGPRSSTGMDNTLSTNLSDWYVVHATAPSGDLQPASYYAAEVGVECLSIGA